MVISIRLIAYNAQTGDKLAEFLLEVSQTSPPMSVLIGGKQYIFVTGGAPQGAGGQARVKVLP
jgi:hypothetical protein